MRATIQDLPMLEQMRQTFQRHRIQMGNRITAVEQERSSADTTAMELFQDRFEGLENEVSAMIADTIKDHELWPWLDAVKGVGPGLAGALIAPIDITRARSISALWRYAGQGVNEAGERDRRVKGEKLTYNAGLKKTCYLVATSFMRSNSPYRREYDEAKEHYQRTHPDWTDGHRDMAAKRRMVKLFLSHLWLVWRYERRLPLSQPYAIDRLGHGDLKLPWEYVPNFEYSREFQDTLIGRQQLAA